MTIKSKISLFSTLVFGLFLVGFAVLIDRAVNTEEVAKLDDRLDVQAGKVQAEFEEEAGKPPAQVMQLYLSEGPEGMEGIRLQLYGKDGKRLMEDSLLAPLSSAPVLQALGGVPVRAFVKLGNTNYRILWTPIRAEGAVLCVLHVAAPMTQVEANLGSLRLIFFVAIPLVLLLTAFASRLITGLAFRPMRSMVETAQRISARNLETRLVLPPARDEVRLLAETLNGMIERLEAAFNSQRSFVADASHELRTPLTVISNELQFAEKRTTDPTILESIRTSVSEINRLAAMAEKMLLLARLDAPQQTSNVAPIRLDELMVECVQRMLSVAAKKNISIETTVEEPLEFNADAEQLKSALTNLIENAIKYSNRDSSIAVRLRSSAPPRGRIRLIVEDHGCGIAPADLPNIFKRFYRADSARADVPGSGLGLAIAERIAALHGGTIAVESHPGHGSTFAIELPGR